MIRAPDFWYRPPGLAAKLLSPIGSIISHLAARRQHKWGWAASVPVLCCGNLTVGGAGKTTVGLDLVSRLKARGVAVHVITRGYGGKERGPLRVDLDRHTAADVGDEALLLAAVAPCWIGSDRVTSAHAAIAAGAQCLIMDDGYQNPGLHKTMSLMIVDGATGFGNGHVLPAGPLRESPTGGLSRAYAVMIIGPDRHDIASRISPNIRVIRAELVMEARTKTFRDKRVIAFAGLARPDKFFSGLKENGVEPLACIQFPDHHPYSERDLRRLAEKAAKLDAVLVTTPKDAARIPQDALPGLEVLGVGLKWADPDLPEWILDRLLAMPVGAVPKPAVADKIAPVAHALSIRVETIAAWLALKLIASLNPAAASNLCGAFTRSIGPLLPVSRVADLNLQLAMPELDRARRRQIIRGAWENLGRTIGEFPHLGKLRRNTPSGPGYEIVGVENLPVCSSDRPATLLFSGHIGNWEMLPTAVARSGLAFGSFYRAADNPLIDALIRRVRDSAMPVPMPLFAKGAKGARNALAHVVRGGNLGMLVDQKMNDGIEARFFGKPAMTAPALAAMALRLRCPVIPGYVERVGPARLRVIVEPRLELPDSGDRHADILALTQAANDCLERWIRQNPSSWLWLHRRWPKSETASLRASKTGKRKR